MSEHNEANDRKVLMSETLFVYLARRANREAIVQIRWPAEPRVEMVTYWEPVVTVVNPPYDATS